MVFRWVVFRPARGDSPSARANTVGLPGTLFCTVGVPGGQRFPLPFLPPSLSLSLADTSAGRTAFPPTYHPSPPLPPRRPGALGSPLPNAPRCKKLICACSKSSLPSHPSAAPCRFFSSPAVSSSVPHASIAICTSAASPHIPTDLLWPRGSHATAFAASRIFRQNAPPPLPLFSSSREAAPSKSKPPTPPCRPPSTVWLPGSCLAPKKNDKIASGWPLSQCSSTYDPTPTRAHGRELEKI